MTIRQKIRIAGPVIFLIFLVLSLMNGWTYHQVMTSLTIRDSVTAKLDRIEEFAKWKTELVRSVSNMVVSGQVPAFIHERYSPPAGLMEKQSARLVQAARYLTDRIATKEKARSDSEATFQATKNRINTLYTRLDEEISTALALAQMDQVLGTDASDRTSLAPYVLKTLNQMTLTGLNALISKSEFTQGQKRVLNQNVRFISSQIHLIDPDHLLDDLFRELQTELDRLDLFIIESRKNMAGIEAEIMQASQVFEETVRATQIDRIAAEARSEADHTGRILKKASRLNFIMGIVLLILVPLLIVIIGTAGLNSLILNPLSRLAHAMKEVENGRFDATAAVEAPDEIGNLAQAFNTMTGQIQANFTEIQGKTLALRKEHARFISIMDAMDSLVYVSDPETNEVLFMNRYGRKIWGDYQGKTCWQVLQKNQEGQCPFCRKEETIQKSRSEAYPVWEYQNTINGEWYQASAQLIQWPGNRMVHLQVATNISRIKQAEQEHLSHLHFLRTMDQIHQVIRTAADVRQMLRDILETVLSTFNCDRACLVHPCDPETSFFRFPMACSRPEYPLPVELDVDLPAFFRLKSAFTDILTREEPTAFPQDSGIPFSQTTQEKWQLRSHMAMSLHPKTGKPWLLDLHQCAGPRVWTHEEKRLFKEIGHRIEDGLSSFLFLRSLTESEERYRQIVEGTDNLVTEVDAEGRFTFVNETAARIFGLSPEECIGLPAFDFIHPDDRESTQKVFRRAVEEKVPSMALENRQVSRSGEIRDMLWTGNLRFDGNGDILSVQGIARDISERKKIEAMMIQSEKMLSVGGLAAGMAHEINNPLAAMIQNASVLANRLSMEKNIPANVRAAQDAGTSMEAVCRFMEDRGIPRMIRAITESGRRIAGIVDNMLSFARKEEASVSSHDPAKLLDRILDLAATDYDLKKQYDFKNIVIKKEYGDHLPMVPCEKGKLQQVFLNILRNGAQAMTQCRKTFEDRPPCFTLRLIHEKEKNMIRWEIEDNGPGMDDVTRRRVFEPFFTTKPEGVGTGLGLSVSYFIITKSHGGEMWVESLPGKGSNFIIRLPLKRINESGSSTT